MAFPIRNLKIRQQVLLVTLPPVLALLVSIALSFYIYWITQEIELSTGNAAQSVATGQALLRNLAEIYLNARAYLRTGRQPALAAYQSEERDFEQSLATLRSLESDNLHRLADADRVRDAMKTWQDEWVTPNFIQVQQGRLVQDTRVLDQGELLMSPIRSRLEEVIREQESESRASAVATQRMLHRILALGVGVALFLAGMLIFLTRVVTRLISQPLRQLIEASERVSRGDFAPPLPPAAKNEFGQLTESFSRMTAALQLEHEELAALNRFFEAVSQCTTPTEIYQHILHSMKERFQPRQVMIFQLNPVDGYLEVMATLEPLPEQLRAWPVIEEPHNCKAVRMGRHFTVNDVTREPLCSASFAVPPNGSYYCSPMIAGGNVIGAVRLEGPVGMWTPERERLAESYLSGAASALSNLRLLAKMQQQANVDELTRLYNRRFLEDYARKQIAIASRKETPLGVIMMDLDRFKEFNDLYGHEVGDRILRDFAKTMTHAMRETNLAARYGGEEFVVLLPDTSLQACQLVAERIRCSVEKMAIVSGADKPLPRITVSLGIAVYPDHGRTFEELINASDKALYDSKRAGRNRVSVYMTQAEPAG